MNMVRKATKKDISRIAEIIVFGKRVAYRSIFQNDEVSFNEMQVIPLWEEYKENPEMLEHMLVFDDGIVKGVINCKPVGDEVEICEFYVEPFFKSQVWASLPWPMRIPARRFRECMEVQVTIRSPTPARPAKVSF